MGCRQSKEKMCNNKDMLKHVGKYFTVDMDSSSKKMNMADQIIISRKINNKKTRQELLEESISKKSDKIIISKYDIQGIVGKGKFTKVYRVQNKLSKEPFALKLNCQHGGNCSAALETEVFILQRISHRNIVKISEIFMKDDYILGSIVTLCTGGTLLDKLLTTPLLEKESSKIIGQVLDALEYIHGVGITHRDLKPSNILFYLPAKNYIVITDFTLAYAKKSQDDLYMRDICGTPDFLAPEVVRREPYSHSVDLWAVGVITYMMLTCLYPFDNSERSTLFKQIANAQYKDNDEAILSKSAESRDFISSLLVVSKRPSASECLQHPWIGQRRRGYTANEIRRLCERTHSSHSSSSSGSSLESIRRLSGSFHLRDNQQNNRVSNRRNEKRHNRRKKAVNVY